MLNWINRFAWLLTALVCGVLLAPYVNDYLKTKSGIASKQTFRTTKATSYANAVELVEPSVVNIFFTPREYSSFYKDPKENLYGTPIDKSATIGSGVIIDNDGHIVTSYHVIENAEKILVGMHDGSITDATVIGIDPESDLAVLLLNDKNENFSPVQIADSDLIRNGDIVLAIGNPFGIGKTATMGIISATGRNDLGINVFESFIQTDASINPGNSGGALINVNGELIGINTAIFSHSGSFQGISFAIPSNQVIKVVNSIIQTGEVVRGWIGASIHTVKENNNNKFAAEIIGLFPDGPAEESGLLPGDILLSINQKIIGDSITAREIISIQKPGRQLDFKIKRDDQIITLAVIIGKRPITTK